MKKKMKKWKKWKKWKKMIENDWKWKKMKENERKWNFIKKWKKEKIEKWKKNEKKKKMKKWKNEKKSKKWKKWKKKKKMKKNDEKRKKNEKNWIHTKNPRRFPVFTVVVVTFFVKIFDDSHDFFRNVSLSRGKSTTRFGGVIVFPKKSDNFHWTWNKNTHFTDENEQKKSPRSAHLTIIILLE